MSSYRPRCLVCSCGLIVTLLLLSLLAAAPADAAAPPPQAGDPGEQIFLSKCAGCHTIGQGDSVGPDLQGVTERRDAEWLHAFIVDPNQLFGANDPIALQLLAEYNNVRMPALGLSDADVGAVITYLQGAAAAPAAAQPAGPAGDPAAGQRLFTGEQPLANSGPPCLTCHSVSGVGALGGGALGPDLTHVYQRYGGSQGLPPVLSTIAFPTMAGPYAGHELTPGEVADLVAFFEREDARQAAVMQSAAGSLTTSFWLLLGIGVAGAVVLTLILLAFWPRQRQSISARLRSSARTRDA